MAYLTIDHRHRVYYEDYGSGDKAVVLVHGWGSNLRAWDYTLPALWSAGYRTVLLDHRGCGQSDKDFDDMSIEAIASDVLALIDELGIGEVVLNGWSLGGAVVVSAASQLGGRCKALALTCGATPVYIQKPDYPYGGTEEAMAATVDGLNADRINFLSALAQGVCAVEVTPAVQQWIADAFLQTSPAAVATIAALGPLDQRGLLNELDMPIISFVGNKDAVVDPNVCRSVIEYNAGARLHEFEHSGHAPFIEESEAYNKALLEFIAANI